MEDNRVQQARELKNLGTQGFIATKEDTRSRNPTATEPEVTDDESTVSTARNEPPGRNAGTSRWPMTINNLKVTDTLLTVETLYGKDDIGVEEFVKSVKFARNCINDQNSLLKMIIAQKISGHEKRNIFCHISNYEELYEALRSQVSVLISKARSRTKLQNIR